MISKKPNNTADKLFNPRNIDMIGWKLQKIK